MDVPSSFIGRLLGEIFWEGDTSKYREGGRGLENVLTTEVFQALDFLPRVGFLDRVLSTIRGAGVTVNALAAQVEHSEFELLPGNIFLAEHPSQGRKQLYVQPDGVLRSPDVYCLMEAKRIGRSSFQGNQLAREYVATIQEAGTKSPLLLLIIPDEPPVPVRSHGRMSVHDAIAGWLEEVVEGTQSELPPISELVGRIDSIVGYTTWADMATAISVGRDSFENQDLSVAAAVKRVADAACDAVAWHDRTLTA